MKNYTSTVPAERSIAIIEKLLAKAGATNVNKTYQNGQVLALTFTIIEPKTKLSVVIQLPANSQAIYKVLINKKARFTAAQAQKMLEQSERTAWKIMLDWVEVQLSMIEMQQAELLEIFLPYVKRGETTLYQMLRESNFKSLPSPKQG